MIRSAHLRRVLLVALIFFYVTAGFAGGGYLQPTSYVVSNAYGAAITDLAVADLNGDGRDDLLAIASTADPATGQPALGILQIFLGQPDGTLQPGATYNVGYVPGQIILTHLDGDTNLDVIVVNRGQIKDGTIPGSLSLPASYTVLLGKGDGTFNLTVDYPLSVAGLGNALLFDVNLDGRQDLVTTANFGSQLLVLFGNGSGTFLGEHDSAYAGGGYLVLGDFDGDGKIDVVSFNNGGTTSLATQLGNGDGTFQAPFTQSEVINFGYLCTSSTKTGDFNNDGKLDFAVGNALVLGNGDGTFQPSQPAGSLAQPVTCTPSGTYGPPLIADFNGDGKLDRVSINNSMLFEPGYQDAAPDQPVHFDLSAVGGDVAGPFTARVGNFSGNGNLSIVSAGGFTGVLALIVGDGNGNFQAPQVYPSGNAPGAIAVGDFNNDGFQDQIIANRGDNTVTLLLSRGNGTFRYSTIPTGTNPQGVAVGDFGNGNQDFAVTNANDNTVGVYIGDGTGNFAAPVTYPVGTDPRSLAVEDFNQDGKLDLVTVNKLSNTTSVLLGNGNGTFQSALTFRFNPGPIVNAPSPSSSLSSPREITVADLNGDGFPDMAIVNEGSNTVSVLLNDKTGHFPSTINYLVGSSPLSLAIGDLNGDGVPDLITANSGSNNMSVLIGKGDGTFTAGTAFSAGSGTSPAWVTLLSSRNNGKLDAVVANSATNALSIFYGNGDGTFQQPPVSYAVGLNPQYTHSGNFSGGGVFDLSAANNLSNTISVLLNAGVAVTQLKSSNASSTYGQSVTFTATVSPSNKGSAAPTGNVTFSDNGTVLATIGLNASGVTSYSTAPLALNAGTHVITAAYSGDKNYYKNTTTFVQNVSKAASSLFFGYTMNPSTYGQNVTFYITLTSAAGIPGGTVSLADGATHLATLSLSTAGIAQFSTASLAAGVHTLQAAYGGDANHSGASGLFSQTVNPAATSTAIASSKNPSAVGESVTFTAAVTDASAMSVGNPTGTVTFFDGTTSLGSSPVNTGSGQATLAVSTLAFGSHSITAVYNGDANFVTSTSPAISQSVLHATTIVISSSSANPSTFGQQVGFTATVSSPDGGTPTGQVGFTDETTGLGALVCCLNASGQIVFFTFPNQPLSAGTHSIVAAYQGDSNFVPSTSVAFNQTVNSVANFTIASLTHVPQPVVHIGENGTFTATLSNQSGAPVDDIVFSFNITGGRGYFFSGSFTVSSGGAGTCDISSQPVTCDIGTMNASDTATITIKGVPTLAHTLTATASVNATTQTKSDTVQVRFRPFRQ